MRNHLDQRVDTRLIFPQPRTKKLFTGFPSRFTSTPIDERGRSAHTPLTTPASGNFLVFSPQKNPRLPSREPHVTYSEGKAKYKEAFLSMPADSTLERPLPSNLDAERSILGAILLDNNSINAAIESVRPDDFFLQQHRNVFNQMIALAEAQQAIDLVTLTEELHRRGELESSGGAPYLASLVDGMPRVSNIEHYARIVKEKAILRNLIHATHNIQQRAFEGEDGADAILDNAESSIFALAEDRVKAGLLPIKDIVRDNFERLEKIFKEGRSITGISTGYGELDKLLSGLQPSELIILAARPSQGKTALALNVAENVALRGGLPVAVFSLEMSKESLLQRLVASVAQVDAHKFRTGHLSKEDWRRMTEALGGISSAPVWIDDAGSNSVLEIGAKARRLMRDKGLKLLIDRKSTRLNSSHSSI